tara:strand:- start:715 stop:1509 length:795 start_codon:yes stop_codon:yes gene_type:complete
MQLDNISVDNLVLNLNKVSPNFHCRCGKKYKHRSSLSRHKKVCIDKDNSDMLIKNLLQINNALLSKLAENPIIQNNTQNIQHNEIKNNNINNQINNDITFKIYLDKNCGNAISLEKFAQTLKITINDYLTQIHQGSVKGVGDMIVNNLKNLDFENRPIHCTNLQKQKFYVKDDTWEEQDKIEVAKKLFPIINKTLLRNVNEIWNDAYGLNWASNEKVNEEYMDTIIILTQHGTTREEAQRQLKTLSYISKQIPLRLDRLLLCKE